MPDRAPIDPLDTDGVIEQVRLQMCRDNLEGALEILGEAYVHAYEEYYQSVKLGMGLQMVDRAFRTLTGRQTCKMVERCTANAEYRLLEQEAPALGATRVLDAGCGEGRVALTLGARHPGIRVDGLEVSATNVSLPVR